MKKAALFTIIIMTSVGVGAVFYPSPNQQPKISDAPSQQDVAADTATTKHFFDYSLSSLGEQNLEEITQRVSQNASTELESTQQQALFSLYLEYKQALTELEPLESESITAIDFEQLHLRILELQQQFFSQSQIERLFSEENLLRELAINKMKLLHDDLDSQQQLSIIEQQLADMPEYIQTAEINNQLIADLTSMSALDTQTKHLARVERVGSEATARLETLDLERETFQTTLDSYLQQREEILTSSSLSEQDRVEQIALLRKQSFDPIQLKRVQALERIHDQQQ